MFCAIFAGFLKIIAPGVGLLHNFSAPGVGVFHFFVSGGEEFVLSKDSPGDLPGGCSGLELTDTLVLDIARTVSRLRSRVSLLVHFNFAFGILFPST